MRRAYLSAMACFTVIPNAVRNLRFGRGSATSRFLAAFGTTAERDGRDVARKACAR